MDLRLSPDEELLRDGARELLARRAPLDKLAAAESDPLADDPALWAEMAGLGWLGLGIPESLGGSGGALSHLELVAEEVGRALGPVAFIPVAVAAAMLAAAGGEAPDRVLRQLVDGSTRPVPALTGRTGTVTEHPGLTIAPAATPEPNEPGHPAAAPRRSDAGHPTPAPEPNEPGHPAAATVAGEKGFVDAAAVADWLLATAAPAGGGDVRVVLVDAHGPGVSVTPRPTIAGWTTARVTVDAAPVVADLGGAALVDVALTRAAVLQAGWCAGAAGRLLEDTVAYVSGRVQFGVPIGSFQSVQHRLADCSIAVAEATMLARQAAAAAGPGTDESRPARRLASTAFVRAADAFVAVARHCHQVWGGLGFGTEAPVHLFSRRAKAAQLAWGGPDHHLDVVAAEVARLELVRDRYPRLGPGRSRGETPIVLREQP